MPYFNYHARNKKLIKEGLLEDYYYIEKENKRFLMLVFKGGKQFPIKEERWMEYSKFLNNYSKGEQESEKGI